MLGAACVVGLAVVALGPGTADAWPGDPDGAWGACGTLGVPVTAGQAGEADGVLVAAGSYVIGGSAGTRALVARFSSAGGLDPTFGTGGRLTFAVADSASLAAIARQSDGKIVGAGTRTADGSVDSLVVRVMPDGRLDRDFHGNGRVVMDLAGSDKLTSVAVQSNGAIVVGGTAGSEGEVARLLPNGDPDPSFDGDGRRTGMDMTVQALVLQPDGKIVVGGRAGDDFAIKRLNSDGSTDATFNGVDGVRTDLGGADAVTALALDADGKIVAAGYGHGPAGSGHTIVRRYDADGTRDTDFQPVDRAFGLDDQPTAVLVRSDGKVVVAGNSKVEGDNDVLVLRLNGDGTRDQSFGIGGITFADAGARPVVRDVVVRTDGRTLVAGSLHTGGARQVALWRFQGDASTAARPAQGYVIDGYGTPYGFAAGCATNPARPVGFPKWPGTDVARGIAVLPGGRGLEVDAFGGLHPFRIGDGSVGGLTPSGNTTWTQDMARGVAVVPEGTGGFVVDKTGRLRPFELGDGAKPKIPAGVPSWPGQDVARGVALLPNGGGGYVLDEFGGLHAFGGAPASVNGAASFPGQDLARGVAIAPDGSGGWVLDAFGGLHPFGIGANPRPPATVGGPDWGAARVARGVAALP